MSKATLLTLPAELRLQIATYVFEEQGRSDPFTIYSQTPGEHGWWIELENPKWVKGTWINEYGSLSKCCALLSVCKQFRSDFTKLAFQNTRFTLLDNVDLRISCLSQTRQRDLRKIAVVSDWKAIAAWKKYPFDNPNICLEELCIVYNNACYDARIIPWMRRIQNVKVLKFVRSEGYSVSACRDVCFKLIGAFMQEDHYHRYDVQDAPQIEDTWWSWQFHETGYHLTFLAQSPKPLMTEEAYMSFIGEKVKEFVSEIQKHT